MALGKAESCHCQRRADLHVAEDFHSCLLLGRLIGTQRIDNQFTVGGGRRQQGIVAIIGDGSNLVSLVMLS